jgi:effector-binding domain-containing protein
MPSPVVSTQVVAPRKLAAVRRQVTVAGIAAAWKPALDQVWAFLRERPELRTDGHNVFLYHHGAGRNAPMTVEFGVEVSSPFEPSGEVIAAETPAGEVAFAVHVGSYATLSRTHDAIHAWCAAEHRAIAGQSWEIYGDFESDESKLATTVLYLLE